jgi:hypothetical protein
MQLGTLLSRLDDEADAASALEAMGDLVLFAEVARMSGQYGETAGEYVANAARRFAAQAGDEDWLGLMGALERSSDPARAALERMLRWALARDAAEADTGAEAACACGAGGRHEHP